MPRARRRPSAPPPIVAPNHHGIYRRAEAIRDQDKGQMVNDAENRLRELEWLGALTSRQREAGELFEADYRTVTPIGGRDCLDISPRGGKSHETEREAEAYRRAAARVKMARDAAGPWYAGLRDLAVFRVRLKAAALVLPPVLDRIADAYGLPG